MSGTQYDDPNREAVGLAPIWTGAGEAADEPEQTLDTMTKDELLAEADRLGVVVGSNDTKAEIRAAIEAG